MIFFLNSRSICFPVLQAKSITFLRIAMHFKLNTTPAAKTPLGFYIFQQSDDGEIYATWLLRSCENIVERKIAVQLVKLLPFFTNVYDDSSYT